MEKRWNKKNALWQLVYVLLYFVATLAVCGMGAVHPVLFVLYQVTAGVLITGITVKAFERIQAPFVALSFSLGLMLIFLLIGEFNLWHALPIAVIGILAEVIGLVIGNEKWAAIVAKSVVMSFSTFGYYGQIWFNRDFTYDCAVEEMPAGYAQQLMDCSPAWALPAVVIVGIGLSVCAAFITRKLFRLNVD
ncbi:MptD family putative ECF transporter S component [Ruminococcus albus]|uniref:TIGR02185 family protein n=1 Tax=Ruminococcus albus 8 TaxID=246199 RepID=E9S8V2_RUMAL|nr:MptD family putative ECF transporter S component [Ruminococcus albus]EGC04297.1 hypothetical protein CUS_5597 [Ruminococcus albus 8]MCC3349674.1 MptD family putative ECF transporter S component [Ruminococcus albus 8]